MLTLEEKLDVAELLLLYNIEIENFALKQFYKANTIYFFGWAGDYVKTKKGMATMNKYISGLMSFFKEYDTYTQTMNYFINHKNLKYNKRLKHAAEVLLPKLIKEY